MPEITSQNLWSVWGPRLRAAREAEGLTQEQLAERSGVGQPVISAIERKVRGGRDATQVSLARALNRPVAEIFPRDIDSDSEATGVAS